MHILDIFKILGCLVGGCEIVCSMVGIAYMFDYLLSNLPQDTHNRQLRDSKSDGFFDRICEDCVKHGPVNLEDYHNKH